MPELPEVETTRRGVEPHLIGRVVAEIELRERRMRWPVQDDVLTITGEKITTVRRRAKYLLIGSESGTLILHLGMSGSLRICPHDADIRKHDHFLLRLANNQSLRLHDPRRFGAVLWHSHSNGELAQNTLFNHLGPEPLDEEFSDDYFFKSCAQRNTVIKQHIMNNRIVVGVGNIYACEALFRSGIHPKRKAGKVSKTRLHNLHGEIRTVLTEAIEQGGTTLRDFVNESGQPGYFKQQLHVYGREGLPCTTCGSGIKRIVIGNRSTFYCSQCQR